METILIMAKALAKASGLYIVRLDIQYHQYDDEFVGNLYLQKDSINIEFAIRDNGTVEKIS